MCGGNFDRDSRNPQQQGLSPRVRGKRADYRARYQKNGSIPACAGETVGNRRRAATRKVYPRVCGGNYELNDDGSRGRGLSPRVRGKRIRFLAASSPGGSIPACAGETFHSARRKPTGGVYPRVCGGNGVRRRPVPRQGGLSPRVRGKRTVANFASDHLRSIPACAGETSMLVRRQIPSRVYPRVCGGNGGWRAAARDFQWSIPACAGETALGILALVQRRVYPRVCGGNFLRAVTALYPEGLSPRVRGKRGRCAG